MKLTSKHISLIFKKMSSKNWIERNLQKHYRRIYSRIIEQTSFLDAIHTPSFLERLFCIMNEISEPPKCKICGENHVKFNAYKMAYLKWCSAKCQASDPECVKLSKQTRLAKYGNKNYNGIDKSKITRYSKNSGKWHADDFGDKVKNRKLLNGHDANWNNAEKRANTISERMSEDKDFWKKREIKTKETKILNGHDPNWNNREKFKKTLSEFSDAEKTHRSEALKAAYANRIEKNELKRRRKIKKTCIERFGCYPTFNNQKIKEKIKETCRKNFGTEYYFSSKDCREKRRIASIQKTYRYLENCKTDTPCFTYEEFELERLSDKNLEYKHEYDFKCKKCGMTFKSAVIGHGGIHDMCSKCYPKNEYGTSNMEKEMVSFICSLCGENSVISNTRKIIEPYELDAFIPNRNIAFEFDGLYWHSSDVKHDAKYHIGKTEMCEKNGIRLIHVFEDEWVCKRKIVESRICDIIGVFNKTIFARNCEIRNVSKNESRTFQNENHIQGTANASVNLGLYFEGELVSLMTFGKCRFDKKHEWEMLRFCCKLGYHIPGAASKLLKYFEKTYSPKSLVSYADRRWSQGNLYVKLGFAFSHNSKPDYWYFKHSARVRYSRLRFQKHKLRNLLEDFDENKSEFENMKTNGYHRIYDCGNCVFEKIYNN